MTLDDDHKTRATNWYVITGGPGCSKTTMVNLLRERGYDTTIEHAGHFLILSALKKER
ncbi:MAG TPA: hypothetical protein VF144_05080 [Chitinophagaceae bacterium]